MGLLEAYDLALRKRPVRTKLLTSVFIDALSQQLSFRLGGAPGGLVPTARQCTIGLISTIIVDKWFTFAEWFFRALPPDQLRTVLLKTVVQMAVLQPTLCTYYVSTKKLLQGELSTLVTTLRESLVKLTVAGWSLWGPTAAIQYRFVPDRYRALVNSLVGLVYTVYLIVQTPPEEKEKETVEQERRVVKKQKQ
eukprot:TRINITY_DN20112_c1_g1_i2.p2 TRINITY_DN20112_c1_g1~~TRINITY_DN20112_c1_g1_i2.p2  ORF type:complete len:193 (+),score=46.29 TRINITY_DN20112_c1_g1_i2:71-649(+)